MRARGLALMGTMALLAGSLVEPRVPSQLGLAAQAPRPRGGVVHTESSVASGAGLSGPRGVLGTTVKFAATGQALRHGCDSRSGLRCRRRPLG